jgi:hypothetical protein
MTKRAKGQGKPGLRLGQHLTIKGKLHAWVEVKVKQGKNKPDAVKMQKVVRPRLMHAWLKVQAGLDAAARSGSAAEENQKDKIARALKIFETADRATGKGKAQKSVHILYGPEMASFENFVLMCISEGEADCVLVKQWESGDAAFLKPFTVETIALYLRYLSEPKGKPLGINDLQLNQPVLTRGCGKESVLMAHKALSHFHKVACLDKDGIPIASEQHVNHPKVLSVIAKVSADYVAEGAPQFEVRTQ